MNSIRKNFTDISYKAVSIHSTKAFIWKYDSGRSLIYGLEYIILITCLACNCSQFVGSLFKRSGFTYSHICLNCPSMHIVVELNCKSYFMLHIGTYTALTRTPNSEYWIHIFWVHLVLCSVILMTCVFVYVPLIYIVAIWCSCQYIYIPNIRIYVYIIHQSTRKILNSQQLCHSAAISYLLLICRGGIKGIRYCELN